MRWLKNDVAPVLADLATGRRDLTHEALDELPDSQPLAHLRQVLIGVGALPQRDGHMIRIQRFVDQTWPPGPNPEQRQVLHRYTIWQLIRRLRQRNNGRAAPNSAPRPPLAGGPDGPEVARRRLRADIVDCPKGGVKFRGTTGSGLGWATWQICSPGHPRSLAPPSTRRWANCSLRIPPAIATSGPGSRRCCRLKCGIAELVNRRSCSLA